MPPLLPLGSHGPGTWQEAQTGGGLCRALRGWGDASVTAHTFMGHLCIPGASCLLRSAHLGTRESEGAQDLAGVTSATGPCL